MITRDEIVLEFVRSYLAHADMRAQIFNAQSPEQRASMPNSVAKVAFDFAEAFCEEQEDRSKYS